MANNIIDNEEDLGMADSVLATPATFTDYYSSLPYSRRLALERGTPLTKAQKLGAAGRALTVAGGTMLANAGQATRLPTNIGAAIGPGVVAGANVYDRDTRLAQAENRANANMALMDERYNRMLGLREGQARMMQEGRLASLGMAQSKAADAAMQADYTKAERRLKALPSLIDVPSDAAASPIAGSGNPYISSGVGGGVSVNIGGKKAEKSLLSPKVLERLRENPALRRKVDEDLKTVYGVSLDDFDTDSALPDTMSSGATAPQVPAPAPTTTMDINSYVKGLKRPF